MVNRHPSRAVDNCNYLGSKIDALATGRASDAY
jgi:hypothetical protein